MRLITVATDDGPRAAVERAGFAVLVPPADGSSPYEDVGALLRAGPAAIDSARRALDAGLNESEIDEQRLLRPVLHPGAVVCVGLNYRTHIREMGREMPTSPTLFSKLPRALTDPYADVAMPEMSEKVDYEGELAAVIGSGGSAIPAKRAWDHVAGLTIFNDVTGRDIQHRTIQWFAGKTFQASTPVGPAVVTLDELGDLDARELRVTVNGEERQRTLLGDMVFDVASLIADLSRIIELEPGDLIATGSPGGVGMSSERFLGDGDVVEVTIDGLGSIRNTFRRTTA
jgi:acylpyruvate hydrolase